MSTSASHTLADRFATILGETRAAMAAETARKKGLAAAVLAALLSLLEILAALVADFEAGRLAAPVPSPLPPRCAGPSPSAPDPYCDRATNPRSAGGKDEFDRGGSGARTSRLPTAGSAGGVAPPPPRLIPHAFRSLIKREGEMPAPRRPPNRSGHGRARWPPQKIGPCAEQTQCAFFVPFT
jgi:hypothetical protein